MNTLSLQGTATHIPEKIAIIDDRVSNRRTWGGTVKDAGLIPHLIEGSFRKEVELLDVFFSNNCQGAISDHRLNPGNFARFNGAGIVATLNQKHYPSLLLTTYGQEDIDEIRFVRYHIPVLLSHLTPDNVIYGFQQVTAEYEGKYAENRRPWQTLLRIEAIKSEAGETFIYVLIPAWDSQKPIRLKREAFPTAIHEYLREDERFYAQVNLGAEDELDLYVINFQYRGSLKGE